MEQLVYSSFAASDLDSSEVFRIIEVSARNNPSRDITGFLVFSQDRFLQLIEGPPAKLDELLRVLRCDPRHRDLSVLARGPIAARCFPDWRMKRIDPSETGADEVFRILRTARVSGAVAEQVSNFLETRRAAA